MLSIRAYEELRTVLFYERRRIVRWAETGFAPPAEGVRVIAAAEAAGLRSVKVVGVVTVTIDVP